ncbi:DUF554 domain-containing protein [Uliginosibacterium paludis]|uniref:DUF554 domain-containing protein n=1 Tax=Uliginosibacterium paludis TaxID=1615952 RepID=A0ABV2CPY0_9RHOO
MFVPLGPYVNGTAVAIGGLAGAFVGTKLPERLRTSLPQTFGLASMGLGISMIIKLQHLPAVILALIVGAIIGELIHLERSIGRVGTKAKGLIERIFPAREGLSPEEFIEKFVAVLVLFCASGTGIFGAMNEGMTGSPDILYVKSILDFFTSGIFATALGYAVASVCLPQVAIQILLMFCATWIMPMTDPGMIADFSAVGGLIMLATGFRIAGVKPFPVANMLPGLLLAMPFSHLWTTLF